MFLQLATAILALVGIVITLLPLLPLGAPLVRIWDFPRVQIAILLGVTLLAAPLAFSGWSVVLLAAAVFACLGWQIAAIFPYTQLARQEVASTAPSEGQPSNMDVTLLAANILISNRSVAPLRRLIETRRPDIVLLLETDRWWDEHLGFLRDAYPHVVARPQENSYGMHLFSRFELADVEVRFLVADDIPSIKARVRACIDFTLYCIHPKPPPAVNADERDAELLIVGKEVRREGSPAVVAGDLNDVAWSRSTRLFQKISGLLDPRKGRGMFTTFSGKLPVVFRWPLDHVFFSEQFHLVELAVLDDIDSDHLPFFVHMTCLGRASGEKPEASAADTREADETIEEGKRQSD